jgi:hypothetical protein
MTPMACCCYTELNACVQLISLLQDQSTRHRAVLVTRSVYVFCVDLRTNSDYFTVQH